MGPTSLDARAWIRLLFAAVLVLAFVAPSAAGANQGQAKGHDHAPGQAKKAEVQDTSSDHDGDADDDSSTAVTEDSDGDGFANTPDPLGDRDNQHPSGQDQHAEAGNSGTQGRSESDPDGDSNGGADKPGGTGGVDQLDQDGNNGCGNDDDFEDDNNGLCLGPQRGAGVIGNRVVLAAGVQGESVDVVTAAGVQGESVDAVTAAGVQGESVDADEGDVDEVSVAAAPSPDDEAPVVAAGAPSPTLRPALVRAQVLGVTVLAETPAGVEATRAPEAVSVSPAEARPAAVAEGSSALPFGELARTGIGLGLFAALGYGALALSRRLRHMAGQPHTA